MSADITTLDVAIAGGRTRLDSLGTPTDPTIVYLHSALLDGRMWHATMHAFASLPGRPVTQIAYDMRGHGAAVQSGELRDVTQLAEDLTSLLDNLSLDAVHIVGVSMGGAVAQQFAARAPQRVHSLTLIATSADFPSLPLMDRAAAYRTRTRRRRPGNPRTLAQRHRAGQRDCAVLRTQAPGDRRPGALGGHVARPRGLPGTRVDPDTRRSCAGHRRWPRHLHAAADHASDVWALSARRVPRTAGRLTHGAAGIPATNR